MPNILDKIYFQFIGRQKRLTDKEVKALKFDKGTGTLQIFNMKESKTKRGFEVTEFEDTYGSKCSLQMSSSAMEEKIWFGVNEADPQIMVSKAKENGIEPEGESGWMKFPIPEDVSMTTRMHLNREQVKKLLPYLIRFVKNGWIHE